MVFGLTVMLNKGAGAECKNNGDGGAEDSAEQVFPKLFALSYGLGHGYFGDFHLGFCFVDYTINVTRNPANNDGISRCRAVTLWQPL